MGFPAETRGSIVFSRGSLFPVLVPVLMVLALEKDHLIHGGNGFLNID